MRRRVPKLRQSFTFQGLSVGDMLVVGLLLYLGYKVASILSGSPLIRFGGAFLTYFLLFPRLKAVFARRPPGYFSNYIWWLSRQDVLIPMYDETFVPFVFRTAHNEVDGDEEQEGEPEREVWREGQGREPAPIHAVPGHR